MLTFLLQKKRRFLFDESDDEEMMNFLKTMTYPLSNAVERSSEAEEDQVGSLDCIDGVRGASPITKTTAEVVNTASEMPVGPPTTELLPKSGTETIAPPTVDDARLPSSPRLERVDTVEHSQAAEGARAADGVGS